ncbi:hypothetical protein [Rhodoferax ferrireducens]|uniref:hypothetical protein n=1 Tax=Rhodoferax ferrireducens TaxID=192843 RepID=UPI001300AC03|nr:hypothetical protein [Rhodoferax ferrireducens]
MTLPSLRRRLRTVLSGSSFLIGLAAAQAALATPLILIFEDSLHGPVLAEHEQAAGVSPAGALTPNAVTTPAWATSTGANAVVAGAGLMAFTLNTLSAAGTHAVSNEILKAQVSTSIPLILGSFRVLPRLQEK